MTFINHSKEETLHCRVNQRHISFLRVVGHLLHRWFFLVFHICHFWSWRLPHLQVLLDICFLISHLLSEIVSLFEEGGGSQFSGPLHLLNLLKSFPAILVGDDLDRNLVVSLIVVAKINSFSPRNILHVDQAFITIVVRVNSESCNIKLFWI